MCYHPRLGWILKSFTFIVRTREVTASRVEIWLGLISLYLFLYLFIPFDAVNEPSMALLILPESGSTMYLRSPGGPHYLNVIPWPTREKGRRSEKVFTGTFNNARNLLGYENTNISFDVGETIIAKSWFANPIILYVWLIWNCLLWNIDFFLGWTGSCGILKAMFWSNVVVGV